jgi:FkbM family methyltransferase
MKEIFVYIAGFIVSRNFISQKIKDFIMWPIASRVLGLHYKQKINLKDGFSMMGGMADILERIILFQGRWKRNLWEPKTSFLLENISKNKREIVIAGSHIGYLVLKVAFNTLGKIHTFEPEPSLFKKAKENFSLNPSLQEIIFLNSEALGDEKGEKELYSEEIRSSFVAYAGGHVTHNNTIKVEVLTLDSYIKEKSIGKIDLILLDVEGYEWHVLNGAKKILENKPDLILEISPKILRHTKTTPGMILDLLKNNGYKIKYLDEDKDYANIYATTQ